MVSIGFHSQAQNLESPFNSIIDGTTESRVLDPSESKIINSFVAYNKERNRKAYCSI